MLFSKILFGSTTLVWFYDIFIQFNYNWKEQSGPKKFATIFTLATLLPYLAILFTFDVVAGVWVIFKMNMYTAVTVVLLLFKIALAAAVCYFSIFQFKKKWAQRNVIQKISTLITIGVIIKTSAIVYLYIFLHP